MRFAPRLAIDYASSSGTASAPRPVAAAFPLARLRRGQPLNGRAVWIWVLSFALILYLGCKGGGYDLIVRSEAGVIVWWAILLGSLVGILPAARPTRSGWLALGLFFAFTIWSALASSWSLSRELSFDDVSRLACYLGVLALAVLSFGDRRDALRHVVAAVASAFVVIALLALVSRLRPGTFSAVNATTALLPGAHARLSWPLGYWNALGALVVMALPLLLGLATSARRLAVQALAAAAVPLLILSAYLTFSRGAAIAVVAGAIAFFALASDRIPKLATGMVCAGGGALLVAAATRRSGVEHALTTAAARHQGMTLLVAAVLVSAGVGVAQVGLGLGARHGTLARWLRVSPSRARVLLAAAIVVAIVAALAAGAPHRLDRAWQQFKQGGGASVHHGNLSDFGKLSGESRYDFWRVAVKDMPGHWLGGRGPGTFQLVWLPRANVASYVRNAHSLYIETLSDTGLVGLVLLSGFLIGVLATGVYRVVRSRWEERTYAAAIFAAVLVFLLTAAWDWMWQVPVLPVAALLLAAALFSRRADRSAALRSESRGRPDPTSSARSRLRVPTFVARVALALVSLAALIAIAIPLAETSAVRRSQAAAQAGDVRAALADARSAIRIEPYASSAHLQAALVLELQRQFSQALTEARRAAAHEAQNWQTWLIISRLDAELGRPKASVDAFLRARSLNPRSSLFSS